MTHLWLQEMPNVETSAARRRAGLAGMLAP
jgi:hypothetical protein